MYMIKNTKGDIIQSARQSKINSKIEEKQSRILEKRKVIHKKEGVYNREKNIK
jgi:hypothetical protein